MSPVAPPSCNMQASGFVMPWNGPEKAQYTPSFNLQIAVYFDVGINVTYLKYCAVWTRKTRTRRSGRRFRDRRFRDEIEAVNLVL